MTMRKAWTWIGGVRPGADAVRRDRADRPGAHRVVGGVGRASELHERTYRRRGPVDVTPERVAVPGVLDLAVEPGTPWAVRTGAMWTRKRPARLRGTVLGREVDLRGLIDESAGRHPRRLSWWWSAGAGELADGRAGDLEPRRRAPRRRRRVGARGVDRRRAGARPAAAVPRPGGRRRPALHRARDARAQGEPAADRLGLRAAVRHVRGALPVGGELRAG